MEKINMKPFGLPIDAVLGDVRKAFSENAGAVLEALPGAGKTTCIPLALLDEPWLEGEKMLLLAPRRLAARAAAMRMSHLLSENVGRNGRLPGTNGQPHRS
jgi:ATP-dependent helicase HrpB